MLQIVLGSTAGFLLAEALLQSTKLVFVSARRDAMRARLRTLFSLRESGLVDGFVKYAGGVALLAALMVLGGWGLADYLEAKSSASVAKNTEAPPSPADPLPTPANAADKSALSDTAPGGQAVLAEDAATGDAAISDPYSDSEFAVHRRARRGAASLKEAFLQRSEEKARSDLLKQTQDREQRSQYDCEVAAHASRYLKAGLDVWGFSTWQAKYFPLEGYKGASLPECRGIKDVIDSKRINVKSAVANRSNM